MSMYHEVMEALTPLVEALEQALVKAGPSQP